VSGLPTTLPKRETHAAFVEIIAVQTDKHRSNCVESATTTKPFSGCLIFHLLAQMACDVVPGLFGFEAGVCLPADILCFRAA
jgi:hypothetical protein